MTKTYLTRNDESPPGSQQSLEVAPELQVVLASGNNAGDLAIVGMADPTDPQDAATKAYVDAVAPTLAEVLVNGNDTGGLEIVHVPAADTPAIVGQIATSSGSGIAYASEMAVRGAVSAGMSAEVRATGGPRLAFNGALAAPRPELSATGALTLQEFADVLVTLGLVTQAP